MVEAKTAAVIVCCCFVVLASPQKPPAADKQGSARSAVAPSQSASSLGLQSEMERAKQMLDAGSKDQAITLLRKILREDPDNADGHLLLGTALALVPERSEAIGELQRAVELRPTSAMAHFALGTAQAGFADFDPARKMFEKVIQLDPAFGNAHVSLAVILGQQNQLASAREQLLQAIKIQGNSPPAARSHYLLAQVLAEHGELDNALQQLLIATSLRPNYAEAYLAQGLIRRKQLNEVEAINAFKKAVALSPQDFDAQYQLGAACLRVGDTSQAIVHLRQASKLKPGDRSTLYQLCRALKEGGGAEETQACEQELSVATKVGLEVTANLLTATQSNNEGVELEKAGNLAAALEKYSAAVSLDPTQSVQNGVSRRKPARTAIYRRKSHVLTVVAFTGLWGSLEIECQIIRHHNVQITVAVVVDERASSPPTDFFAGHPCPLRNIRERAVTIVVVEDIVAPLSKEKVRKVVVVVVSDADSLSPP